MRTASRPSDISFHEAVDFYLKKMRQGDAPSVGRYAEIFPHLKESLLRDLPLMIALERDLPSPKSPIAEIETKLGSCEIETEIGRGGMAVVYKARQVDLDRIVAVKVLSLFDAEPGLAKRFEQERRAMARLDHPHIVPVFEYGHTDNHAYLVMKYIDGANLATLVCPDADYEAKKMLAMLQDDWHGMAILGANVASGLQHAHENGLIHRDIKPSNLLLDQHSRVWIADFGLAKLNDCMRRHSHASAVVGTPRYMAPEQLIGIADSRSDVYSLGLTLYELAIGETVDDVSLLEDFDGEALSLSLPDVRSRNPDVPESLAKIIMKACDIIPEDRYQTAKELEIVLRRFAEGQPKADRRRRKRLTDKDYRRQKFRRRMMMVASAPLLLILALEAIPMMKNIVEKRKEAVQTPQHGPTPNVGSVFDARATLLDRLAESEKDDIVDVVADFVKETVDETSDERLLSEGTKERLLDNVEDVVREIKSNKAASDSALNSILDNYRRSSLNVGNKVARLSVVIDRSTLSQNEKAAALTTIHKFGYATVKEMIEPQEASALVDQLTHGRSYSADELYTFAASDRQLRRWLASVNARLVKLSFPPYSEMSIRDELESLFRDLPEGGDVTPQEAGDWVVP